PLTVALLLACAPVLGRDTLKPDSLPPPDTTPALVTWVGDILLDMSVGRAATAHGIDWLFDGVREVISADDLSVGNLECAAAYSGRAAKKEYTFRADPRLLPGLKANGIDAVSVANNHSLDFGRDALNETLERLQEAGLLHAGAGPNLESALAPISVRLQQESLAIICASRVAPAGWAATSRSSGIAAVWDQADLLAAIIAAKQQAGIVAVFLHWGIEKKSTPEESQRRLARRCIDAGATLVIGTHPHVVQGLELYRDGLIAYSLGNFIFTNRDNRPALILQTGLRNGRLVSARVIPCRIGELRPKVVLDEADRRQLLAQLRLLSSNLNIGPDGSIALPASGSPD
ncbi:MAG: CapA family protein, partial [candidate division WOR-3 bacterium]